jgi:hypothetical protein
MLYQNNVHWHGEAAQALEAVALAVEVDSSEILSDFPSLIPSILSDLLFRAAADSDFLSRTADSAPCPSQTMDTVQRYELADTTSSADGFHLDSMPELGGHGHVFVDGSSSSSCVLMSPPLCESNTMVTA